MPACDAATDAKAAVALGALIRGFLSTTIICGATLKWLRALQQHGAVLVGAVNTPFKGDQLLSLQGLVHLCTQKDSCF